MHWAHRALILVSLLALTSCKSKKQQASDTPPDPEPAAAAVEPSAAGESATPSSAAIAVTLWPEHWSALKTHVAELAEKAGAGEGGAAIEQALSTPWTALGQLSERAGLGGLDGPPAGLDASRPMTLELFAAPDPFEKVAAAGLGAGADGPAEVAMWPRLRLTLPASDAAELAGAVADMAGEASLEEVSENELFASDAIALRLTRFPSAVIVDLVVGDGVGTRGEGTRRRLLGAPPKAPSGPAFAYEEPSALRLMVRADSLGDLGASMGMAMVMGALKHARPEHRKALLMEGTSEVLSGYLLMDPQTSVAEAAMVNIAATDEGGVQTAFMLSDSGLAAAKAGGLVSGKTMAFSDIAWKKAAGTAELSPVLKQAAKARDVSEIFHECGWSCWSYLVLGNGLQLAGALQRSGELDDVLEALQLEAALGEEMSKVRLRLEDRLLSLQITGEAPSSAWNLFPRTEPSEKRERARRCYREALVGVRNACGVFASADPSQRQALFGQGLVELRGASDCVEADPVTRARFDALSELLSRIETQLSVK